MGRMRASYQLRQIFAKRHAWNAVNCRREREKVAKALHSFQREVYKHLKMMMQWQNEILMGSFDVDAKKCRSENF